MSRKLGKNGGSTQAGKSFSPGKSVAQVWGVYIWFRKYLALLM